MRDVRRAVGRLVARAHGEMLVWIRPDESRVDVRAAVGRTPPTIEDAAGNSYTVGSGSVAVASSVFAGWEATIGVDIVELDWHGTLRRALVKRLLDSSDSMQHFAIELLEE